MSKIIFLDEYRVKKAEKNIGGYIVPKRLISKCESWDYVLKSPLVYDWMNLEQKALLINIQE